MPDGVQTEAVDIQVEEKGLWGFFSYVVSGAPQLDEQPVTAKPVSIPPKPVLSEVVDSKTRGYGLGSIADFATSLLGKSKPPIVEPEPVLEKLDSVVDFAASLLGTSEPEVVPISEPVVLPEPVLDSFVDFAASLVDTRDDVVETPSISLKMNPAPPVDHESALDSFADFAASLVEVAADRQNTPLERSRPSSPVPVSPPVPSLVPISTEAISRPGLSRGMSAADVIGAIGDFASSLIPTEDEVRSPPIESPDVSPISASTKREYVSAGTTNDSSVNTSPLGSYHENLNAEKCCVVCGRRGAIVHSSKSRCLSL